MSKLVFLILLFNLFFINISCAQGYRIEIKVDGSQDSVMYLAYYYADKQLLKDTTEHQGDGLFVFEGEEPLPQGVYLGVRADKNYFEFIVGEDQEFRLSTTTDDLIGDMKISSCLENKRFYEFLHHTGSLNMKIRDLREHRDSLDEDYAARERQAASKKIDSLNREISLFRDEFLEKNADMFFADVYLSLNDPEVPDAPEGLSNEEAQKWRYNYYVEHYFENLDLSDTRMLYTPVIHQRVNNLFTNVLIKDADTMIKAAERVIELADNNEEVIKFLTWFITVNAERSEVMGMDRLYVHMVDNHFSEEKTPWISKNVLNNLKSRADILRNVLIGNKAPNMILIDTSGAYTPLHSVEAKYLVVHFWDAECGHCRRQTPHIKKLYDELNQYGVEIYSVYIDRQTPEKWKKYIRENEMNWIHVYDGQRWTNFHDLYDVYATPLIYLLDEDKKIIAKRIGVDQLREILESNLNL